MSEVYLCLRCIYLFRIIDSILSALIIFLINVNRRWFVWHNITLRTLPRNNPRFHNLLRQQRYLERNKCAITHRNVRSICLHVEITMTVSYKQDLAFRQMSTYVQCIAMMHRRNGRKTDIHTARKKSHASSINHTTKNLNAAVLFSQVMRRVLSSFLDRRLPCAP